jgi:threonine/homoserine/homoserine lactone efflux protein
MTFEMLLSLTGMAFAASWTPGPNNSMLASSGATYGMRASIPHVLGVSTGFPVMIFLVGLGLGELFRQSPLLQQILRYGGAMMLLWIAWKIANAKAPGTTDAPTRPLTFLQAAAFQWVNPKSWLAAIAITSQFITTVQPVVTATIISGVFVLAGLSSTLAWVGLGKSIGRFLNTAWRLQVFNYGMALMLVGFLVLLLIEG